MNGISSNKIINRKEAEELTRKPEKDLKINEAVFVLQKRMTELEKKVATFAKFLIKELSMTEVGLHLYNNIVEKWNKQGGKQ